MVRDPTPLRFFIFVVCTWVEFPPRFDMVGVEKGEVGTQSVTISMRSLHFESNR